MCVGEIEMDISTEAVEGCSAGVLINNLCIRFLFVFVGYFVEGTKVRSICAAKHPSTMYQEFSKGLILSGAW